MIEPFQQTKTPELIEAIQQFNDHAVENPDDDSDLMSEAFRESTDDESNALIDRIEELASVCCFDNQGRPQQQTNAALRRAGVDIHETGNSDPFTKTLQIKTEHGYLTFDKPLLQR